MRVEEVDLGATYDLRRRVLFVEPRPVQIPGDELPETFHLGAFDGDALVGVVTLVSTDHGYQLRGMAVDPDRQRSGAGRRLVEAAAARLRAAGVTRMWCNARDTAIPFYERLGFRISGAGFLHEPSGLPHHPMELLLPRQ